MAKRELLLGCGANKTKRMSVEADDFGWQNLTTLDINPDHKPGVVWDLTQLPLPFLDNSFDEIHAYEVLEHTGQQGDYRFFFRQFSEFWRMLEPDGYLFATVPAYDSLWAWGDLSHSRIINQGTLSFLSQKIYEQDIGKTSMSDFRYLYKADFQCVFSEVSDDNFRFVLQAIKQEG